MSGVYEPPEGWRRSVQLTNLRGNIQTYVNRASMGIQKLPNSEVLGGWSETTWQF